MCSGTTTPEVPAALLGGVKRCPLLHGRRFHGQCCSGSLCMQVQVKLAPEEGACHPSPVLFLGCVLMQMWEGEAPALSPVPSSRPQGRQERMVSLIDLSG